jgi:hypothetical protein
MHGHAWHTHGVRMTCVRTRTPRTHAQTRAHARTVVRTTWRADGKVAERPITSRFDRLHPCIPHRNPIPSSITLLFIQPSE